MTQGARGKPSGPVPAEAATGPEAAGPQAAGAQPGSTAGPGATTGPETAGRPGRGSRLAGWYLGLSGRARTGLIAAAVTIAVIIGLAAAGSAGSAPAAAPAPPAKAFTVPVLGQPGQHLSLSDYAGKPVIVNFFASWCEPCQRETPMLAAWYRDSHGRIPVIGIDVNDGTASAQAFVHKMGVLYPVGVDAPPMPTAAAYNVSGLPQTFFLNARHRIVKRVLGALTHRQLTAGAALATQPAK